MKTIINENNRKAYEILEHAGNNYLLRDIKTDHYIIALGFRDPAKGWDQGKYFDDNKTGAYSAFENYKLPDSYGYR